LHTLYNINYSRKIF